MFTCKAQRTSVDFPIIIDLAVGKVLDGCEFGEVTNDKTEKDIIAQFRLSLQQLKDEQDKAVKEIGTSHSTTKWARM